ncbi:hypothetical protein [Pelagibius sp. Alg239-R121]|uniref:hypothetical protein n=1 Tax=Pelagibius sp. Alg239-R121 TaxID=2993448 RepID=UPI0024A7A225|nr:hypothetical protein [Pelagibius sp. Alg239-R121]
MVDRRVATTRIDDVRPLGDYGQRSFEYITGVVERDLTERHVRLFAEPADEAGGIAWMTSAPGDVVALRSLSEPEAAELTSALGKLIEDILALAQRYADDRDPAAQSLAIALRNAVEVPNDECIFRVGDQPVIVQWAHHLDVYEPPHGVLSRFIAHGSIAAAPSSVSTSDVEDTTPPVTVLQMAPVATTAPPAFSWLWWLGWLLLAVMLAWLLVLALPACGIAGFGFMNFCARAELPIEPETDEPADLEAEIAALERSVADAERQCIVTAERPEPSGPPAPAEPTIEEAIRDRDTSKLAGCWALESDYTLYDGGRKDRPLKVSNWNICFDGEGGGDQELGFTNGMTCKGTVSASVEDDGRLSVLDNSNFPCTPRGQVQRRRTLCNVGQESKASCSSVDFKNPRQGQTVIFRRIPK